MAFFLNLLLPGTGLIIRRREWLGLVVALLFAACTNTAIAGIWIAPLAIPKWLSIVAAILAGISWLLAQVFLVQQTRDDNQHPETQATPS